ncbi:hypothetical protein BV394_11450 [Brevirhabdus pacifica]|uniref:Uncharacterized protein n=1 Tax=Brevirhabdus pacifica TaxID=1267768 RepID=A0A1U7DK40_9RHOB|nr:hypothetical protein [Brevirhabdus pacifica]APX90263.1 hypothetical protein BV394_11450 [Brevirhabdus pacifica]OWU78691.1 hypothetical protein ATO5_08005 [Loktanella sp. 22II-4b]PJJ80708.1 hypothetical protein CLV77_2979 [Brevirhabdus pacifica]
MRHAVLTAFILALTIPVALPADAGPIERACLSGGRKSANRALCGCIQRVADSTLSWSEQRRAAKFFSDPHKAQETRQSSNRKDEQFWRTYKSFGRTAESYCTG